MTIPRKIRSAVGLVGGDVEYTSAQRRIIDAQLDEAAQDPFHGPLNTADEMIAHMKSELKKRAAANKTKRPR